MQELLESSGGAKEEGGICVISLPIKLSVRQYDYLKEIKSEHGIAMAASIRGLIKRDMFGIMGRPENRNRESIKRTRPVTAGSAAYGCVVKEISKIFEARGKSK